MNQEKLITLSGGEVEDSLFVIKPGILLTNITKLTKEAKDLFKKLNISENLNEYNQQAEFNSRITYMSFQDTPNLEKEKIFLNKIVHEYNHKSVYNDSSATFLISGVSVEVELEFVAHSEAKIARLTSSNTKVQTLPLFTLHGNLEAKEKQKEYIRRSISLQKEIFPESFSDYETWNIQNPASKAVSFTVSMSFKDWNKVFTSRFSYSGVEKEMRDILSVIAKKLKEIDPLFFLTEEEYYFK